LQFSDKLGTPSRYEMPARRNQPAPAMDEVKRFADALRADGGTAIFSSVKAALEAAAADRLRAPERAYSVVVMTDGKNEGGLTEADFAQWYRNLPEKERGIPVFGLLFGQAEKAQLEQIANLTGGRVFDARKSLAVAFKEIRGYQ